jgi:HlyD family secretion protein
VRIPHSTNLDLEAQRIPTMADTVRNEWEVVLQEEQGTQTSLKSSVLLGLFTLVLGVGGFIGWSTTTSIAAASIASGRVIVNGQIKKVTAFEGGILDELIVKEGDVVTRGQVLLRLDTKRTVADLVKLEYAAFVREARKTRLLAERDEQSTFEISPEIWVGRGLEPQQVKEVIDGELDYFRKRRKSLQEAISIEKALIEQLESQSDARRAWLKSYAEQLAVVDADKRSLEGLLAQKLTTKTLVSEQTLSYIDLQAKILESEAALMENQQKVAQTKLSIANRLTEHQRMIAEQLQTTQGELDDIQKQIVVARDVVEKATLRAPQDGVVSNIDDNSRTTGSAIVPGRDILDIVPRGEIIIEGRLQTRDIEDVQIGNSVEIRLNSSSSYKLDPIFGLLSYIGSDALADPSTGLAYFPIHVQIPVEVMNELPSAILTPGLGAELFIVNGERTALSYLTQPVRESFSRAFREN